MAACRQLGFDVTGNSAIRSADPENPTLELNMKYMKCIGSPIAEIWPCAYLGGIWNPIWGEGEVVGVSDGTIRKSDGGFSYKLSIVTVALSVTNLRSNVSDAQINTGWVTLGQNFRVFPLE